MDKITRTSTPTDVSTPGVTGASELSANTDTVVEVLIVTVTLVLDPEAGGLVGSDINTTELIGESKGYDASTTCMSSVEHFYAYLRELLRQIWSKCPFCGG